MKNGYTKPKLIFRYIELDDVILSSYVESVEEVYDLGVNVNPDEEWN